MASCSSRNGSKMKENFERSANVRKGSKERVTKYAFMNATGMVKMPLQVIGKANCMAIAVIDHAYQLFT